MIQKTKGSEIRTKKNEIRTVYRARRAAIPTDVKRAYDKAICERFLSSITYRFSKILLLYAPTGDEIDIMPIARRALADGKRVAFPRCDTERSIMSYHFIAHEDDLTAGAYGILEPGEAQPTYDPTTSDADTHPVCIVPGLVFDADGYRIGYGKGYYDRYLATFDGVRIGAVYTDFIIRNLPRGHYDLAVDILITEKGVKAVDAG